MLSRVVLSTFVLHLVSAQVQLQPNPLNGTRGQNLTIRCTFPSLTTVSIELRVGNSDITTLPKFLGSRAIRSTALEYTYGPLEDSDDGSTFTCDDLNGNTDSHNLDVLFSAQSVNFTVLPSSQDVVEGGNATFECAASSSDGTQPYTVVWRLRRGSEVVTTISSSRAVSGTGGVIVGTNGSPLVLTSVMRSLNCVTVSCSAVINVGTRVEQTEPPATLTLASQVQLQPKPLVGVRGQNLTVTCSFPVGTVVIQLHLDNSNIQDHPRYLGATLIDNTAVEYRFGPLQDSDDGSVFTCTDLVGNRDCATLDVQSQDVTISPEGQVVVAEGESLNVTCIDRSSFGDGNALTIERNGMEDSSTTRERNGSEITFFIGPVTLSDNGTVFRCYHAILSQTSLDVILHVQSTNFSTVSPTLIRKITLPSQLAVVLLWSVPASIAGDVDGFVVSVVRVTPSGPKTILQTTVGKQVRAFAVYLPEKGASYQVTVHMTMNGLHSKPLTVEVNL